MDNKNFLKSKLFFTVLSFLIPFIVYVRTLAPTVSFIDTGELATVCIKLGIAHPTGYPLFTILGHLFTFIPIGEEIYRLNLMCAFISSIAVALFFNLLVFIMKDLNLSDKQKNYFASKIDDTIIYLISFAGSLILAFSYTYWNLANSIEVYSLHSFFIVAIIYIILKASNEYYFKYEEGKEIYWILFAFVLGLSFGNHLTTIFLSLGCIYLYFSINGFNPVSYKRIAIMAIPFLIAMSIYIYYPLRADNPIISWGYPKNLENFIRHFTGKQFQVWMFTSTEVSSKQFSYFTSAFPKEFFYIPLIFAIFGLIEFYKNQRKLFYFTILLFAFNVLYAINYDIHDIDSYFILAYIVSSIWITFGILFILKKVNKSSIQIAAVSVLIALIPLYGNFKSNDESKNYYVKDYTMNVFNSARQNSIIISTQWDFFVSAAMYYQFVHNIRNDIAIIDKELLRKSWYLRHLQIHYPEIYERSKSEFEIYKIELIKFEKETDRYTKPKTETDRIDLTKINDAFLNLINSITDKNYKDKSIYVTYEVDNNNQEKFGKEYIRVQEGVLIRFMKTGDKYDDYTEPDLKFEISNETDYYHNFIMNTYYVSYMQRANFLINKTKYDEAEKLIRKGQEINSKDRQAINLLNRINQLKNSVK